MQFCSGIVACMALLALLGAKQSGTNGAPVNALNDRDVYYPGTEDLKPDEMRIVACGTGMPNARPLVGESRHSSKEFICSVRRSFNDRFRLGAAGQIIELPQAENDP